MSPAEGPSVRNRPASEQAEAEPMVRVDHVVRTFAGPGRKRIAALSVEQLLVPKGTGLLVVGDNGAGKTTLLHLLAGLLRADRGRVEVAGRDIGRMTEAERDRWRGRAVGYLIQGAPLLEGLTAAENVMTALLLRGVKRREQRGRAEGLLERFGIAHRARHKPAEMSGGERQRVALARAVAHDPPLILADEPTASLDARAAVALVEHISALRADGRTVVVATHHPELFGEGFERRELRRPA